MYNRSEKLAKYCKYLIFCKNEDDLSCPDVYCGCLCFEAKNQKEKADSLERM